MVLYVYGDLYEGIVLIVNDIKTYKFGDSIDVEEL